MPDIPDVETIFVDTLDKIIQRAIDGMPVEDSAKTIIDSLSFDIFG